MRYVPLWPNWGLIGQKQRWELPAATHAFAGRPMEIQSFGAN